MADAMNSAAADAVRVWSSALNLLMHDDALSPRDRSCLQDVVPESVFGNNIVLVASNEITRNTLQSKLSQTVMQALEMTSGEEMTPLIKLASSKPRKQASQQRREPSPTSAEADTVADAPNAAATAPAHKKKENKGVAEQLPSIQGDLPKIDQREFQSASTKDTVAGHTPDEEIHAHLQSALHDLQPKKAMQPTLDIKDTGAGHTSASGIAAGEAKVSRDEKTHLNKNATFDTFVPGESNRFARAVALNVAEQPGKSFNPLCIYGGSGLGKTHLLNAIGNYALRENPSLTVRYVNSEEFLNEFIESIQRATQSTGLAGEFNKRYRQVDILLIDDIQFLGGKEATLDQFFHTFNALHDANKQIVIASDEPPKKLQGFTDRLITRFDSGLSVDVKPPDRETRIAILRMKASISNTVVPDDVLELIAEQVTDNVRELEGALTRVTAMASLNNQEITRALAEQTLQNFFTAEVEIKPIDIISQVAQYFQLSFDDLVGPWRAKNVALARQIAMYMTREMTSLSLQDIGVIFGGRDHSTVMHAYKKIQSSMTQKREVYNYVNELTVRIKRQNNQDDEQR